MFVASGPFALLSTFVYGPRPLVAEIRSGTHDPKHTLTAEGTIAQTGFGFTTTDVVAETEHPLLSVTFAE